MDYTEKMENKYEKFCNVANYLIIAVISIIGTAFIPMLNSEGEITFKFPETAAGWVVWALTKIITALMNIMIFHCFVVQGKINSLHHPNYMEALNILQEVDKKHFHYIPKSPKRFLGQEYGTRATSIFLMTIVSLIGISLAILDFRLAEFLAMVFTTLITLVFGYLEMKKVEEYWQQEFLAYAKMKLKNIKENEEKEKEQCQKSNQENI